MDLHLQQDWQRALGQYVELRRHGEVIRSGTVAAVTPDNSILWISAEGPFQRQMVVRSEGYEVYSRYPWDPPPPPRQTPPLTSRRTSVNGSAGRV